MTRIPGCLILLLCFLIPLSIYAAFTSVVFFIIFFGIYSLFGWAFYKVFKSQKAIKDLLEKSQIESGIKEIDVMTGLEFEEYLNMMFKRLGYSVILTKASGDFGADLVISRHGTTIVVQAKRYFTSIGIKAVQEVHSSMNYYNADEAWVITNSHYTDAARELAKVNGVVLIDRDRLIELMQHSIEESYEAQQTTTP